MLLEPRSSNCHATGKLSGLKRCRRRVSTWGCAPFQKWRGLIRDWRVLIAVLRSEAKRHVVRTKAPAKWRLAEKAAAFK